MIKNQLGILFLLLLIVPRISLAKENIELSNKKRIFRNISIELLGMKSIVFQKEPFQKITIDPTTSYTLAGYIPRATYSWQFGIQKRLLVYKSFFYRGGFQFKIINHKYEKIENWRPSFMNNPDYIYDKTRFITLSNYLGYNKGSNFICIGFNLTALEIKDIKNYQKSLSSALDNLFKLDYFAYVFRYERNVKITKYRIKLLTEFETPILKANYIQTKVGFSINI